MKNINIFMSVDWGDVKYIFFFIFVGPPYAQNTKMFNWGPLGVLMMVFIGYFYRGQELG